MRLLFVVPRRICFFDATRADSNDGDIESGRNIACEKSLHNFYTGFFTLIYDSKINMLRKTNLRKSGNPAARANTLGRADDRSRLNLIGTDSMLTKRGQATDIDARARRFSWGDG